jgi:hypothetical protein
MKIQNAKMEGEEEGGRMSDDEVEREVYAQRTKQLS